MKKWFSEHKKQVILSMIGTFLPTVIGLLLWNQLPDTMTSHWGADGVADGTAGKAFMVFGMPAILAAVNLLCMAATTLDSKNQNKNKKLLGIVFWIMPMISLITLSSVYAIALGKTMNVTLSIPVMMGVLFIVIGNYMPKATQNRTIGIKIYWTLANEENWNKTHRFAGKVWVAGGIVILLGILLPLKWMVAVMLPVLMLLIVAPMIYSYCIYKSHRKQGVIYHASPASKGEKQVRNVSLIIVGLILTGVMILMVSGGIRYTCGDDALRIDADFQSDIAVPYDEIDEIDFRENFRIGVRIMGFASAKLSMGNFQNDELGQYTLYSYNSCDSMILICSKGKSLAINCQTPEQTQELYQALLGKTSK